MDGPTKASLILAGVAFIIAILSLLPNWLKAKSEADGMRDKAEAKKDQVEADGLDYLIKRAQSNDDTQARLVKSEMNEWRLTLENQSLRRERDNLVLMLNILNKKESSNERSRTAGSEVGSVSDNGSNQLGLLSSGSVVESSGKQD